VRLHQGGPGKLQLFEIQLEPGLEVTTHAHADDEIVFVVDGELHFGRRVCGAGSSFFIPGGTLYGFRAGPEGCRYLNFRAQADSTFFSKEDIVEARG
jgi:quercetin dioxygenase-like cupin family protein